MRNVMSLRDLVTAQRPPDGGCDYSEPLPGPTTSLQTGNFPFAMTAFPPMET